MGAIAHLTFEQGEPKETGSLRDIWSNGYFWRGQFTHGADNRLILTHIIDRLTSVALQMAEKRTAANDLAGYYTHVTGEQVPERLTQRLDEWVRSGYAYDDYPITPSITVEKQRQKECVSYDETFAEDKPEGKRKAAMIPFSDDDFFRSNRAK